MKLNPRTMLYSWRVRIVAELVTLLAVYLILRAQGAPAWAVTLAAYVATRAPLLDLAAGLGALQSTLRGVPPQPFKLGLRWREKAAKPAWAEETSPGRARQRAAQEERGGPGEGEPEGEEGTGHGPG